MTGNRPRLHWYPAPQDWAGFGLPLAHPDDVCVQTDWTVELALELLHEARRRHHAEFGEVLHWAHMLKALQGEDGLWPECIEGKTCHAVGGARTRTPERLFRTLRELMATSEFDTVIARSKGEGESYGI